MNLIVYALIVLILAAVSIWISNESGLNSKTRGFASIAIGLIAVAAILSQIV